MKLALSCCCSWDRQEDYCPKLLLITPWCLPAYLLVSGAPLTWLSQNNPDWERSEASKLTQIITQSQHVNIWCPHVKRPGHPSFKKNKCVTHLRNICRLSYSWQRIYFLILKSQEIPCHISPLIHVYSVFVLMHSFICRQKCSWWLTQTLPYSIPSESFFVEQCACQTQSTNIWREHVRLL